MKLRDRLLRTGAAFLVFSMVTAALPSTATSMTRADACSTWNGFWPGVGLGLIVGGAGGYYYYQYQKSHDDTTGQKTSAQPQGSEWNELHNFVNSSGSYS